MKKITKIAETASAKVKLKKIRVAAYCRVSTDLMPSLKALRHRKPTMKITSHLVMTGSSQDSITTKVLPALRRTNVRSCYASLRTASPVK